MAEDGEADEDKVVKVCGRVDKLVKQGEDMLAEKEKRLKLLRL